MQPADIKRCSPLSQRPGIDPAQHRLTMLLGLLPLLIAVLQWTVALPGVSRLVAGLGVLGLLWLIAVMDEAKAWLGAAIVVPSLCAALGSLLGNQLPVIVAAPALIATATATGVWIDGISRFSNKIDGRMAGDPIELVACVGGMTLLSGLAGGALMLIAAPLQTLLCTGASAPLLAWALPGATMLAIGLVVGCMTAPASLCSASLGLTGVTAAGAGLVLGAAPPWAAGILGWLAGTDPARFGLMVCAGGGVIITLITTLVVALIGLLGLTLLIGMTAESGIRCTEARSVRRRLRRFNIGYVLVGALVLWLGL